MKRAIRIGVFILLTFLIGRSLANVYLQWPAPMPDWLHDSTMFAIRVTGLGREYNPEDAENMATVIVASISWTLTGLVLWLMVFTVRRFRGRPKAQT
ncbi:hypothetical protein [Paraburkholderia solisilvae]|uniref:Uncharacterized protein n=1 Tax=Paraburkholderia solisilvae TaxID=624376 RepID=A0A6J5EX10_9BURK|nr:hypothetical protein [Paraburkholderia solisilvae]CAB3769575.1 hypothetical protein LMG29739_05574 [Paraburkholderia solisilvae]